MLNSHKTLTYLFLPIHGPVQIFIEYKSNKHFVPNRPANDLLSRYVNEYQNIVGLT